MITTDSPLAAAKERLSIPVLWQLLGLPGQPRRSCKSPFHEDRNPSFSIYEDGRKWKDHATGEQGDAVDFVALACELSPTDACRRLIELASVGRKAHARTFLGNVVRAHFEERDERARKRESWPVLETATRKEIRSLAELRGLSPEGVALAAERALLWCVDTREGRAWVVTDASRRNAQARRMDGQPWERIQAKAWTLPGSEAAWPIGLTEASSFPAIALVEGGPDLLAACHLAWCDGMEEQVAPVAMLGAAQRIPVYCVALFAHKRIRVFAHADEAGESAGNNWAAQLQIAGAKVDGFTFAEVTRADGGPVKDLNDFAHISPDDWENDRESIEDALMFACKRTTLAMSDDDL